MTIEEAAALVQDAFAIGMTQSGIEARDFAIWCSKMEIADILELGTGAGGMMYLMHRGCRPGMRISLDMPWDSRDPAMPIGQEEKCKRSIPGIIEFHGQIHDLGQMNRLAIFLDTSRLDLIFIDADHSYDGCKLHVEMYLRFLKPGGFIAFHDCSNGWGCGDYVRKELFPQYEHWLFEEPANLYGIGVVQL